MTAKEQLSEASAPPIRQFTIGTGDYAVKVGGETVMFRHEKTFFNKPGLAVLITDRMDDGRGLPPPWRRMAELQYERVGLNLRPEIVAVKEAGNKGRFLDIVKKAAATPYSLILMSSDAARHEGGPRDRARRRSRSSMRPRRITPTPWARLAKEYACPLAVKGEGLEALAALTEKLTRHGRQGHDPRFRREDA